MKHLVVLPFALLLTFAVLGVVATVSSCAAVPDETRFTYIGPTEAGATVAPDYQAYKAGVNTFLGNQCATLDCHGQLGRPLRLFALNGLRAYDAGEVPSATAGQTPRVSGKGSIDEEEIRSNYLAIIGLEPEEMGRVVARGGESPKTLLLLKKPLLLEGHKGGQVMVDGDFGYNCVTSWLAGRLDSQACASAASYY